MIAQGLLRAISELETGNWKLAVYASRLGEFKKRQYVASFYFRVSSLDGTILRHHNTKSPKEHHYYLWLKSCYTEG